MKRLIPLVLLLLPVTAGAQSADPGTPIAQPSIAKFKIAFYCFDIEAASGQIIVKRSDSGGTADVASRVTLNVPSTSGVNGAPCTTTNAGLAQAMNNAVGGETGTEPRKQLARILNYLIGQGCLAGTPTLVP